MVFILKPDIPAKSSVNRGVKQWHPVLCEKICCMLSSICSHEFFLSKKVKFFILFIQKANRAVTSYLSKFSDVYIRIILKGPP